MKKVYLYVFEARAVRRPPGRTVSPPLFCLLFLLQEDGADRRLEAEQAIWRAGLHDVRFADGPGNGRPVDSEKFNANSYGRVAEWYAEALEKGICLMRGEIGRWVLERGH